MMMTMMRAIQSMVMITIVCVCRQTAAGSQEPAARIPAAKDPGADGWIFRHISGWPPLLLEAPSRFYELVESARRWPACWPAHLVALLPKGCTPDPTDRRPIVLLPVAYRLWAALRAQEMRDWLRSAGILREGPEAAADTLAGLLDLEITTAHEARYPGAGLALDFPKCYDRLPLALLCEVADRAGVPRALSGPMLSC